MQRFFCGSCVVLGSLLGNSLGAEETGVVNFHSCLTDSKQGQKEQKSLEDLQNKLTSMVESKKTELDDVIAKLNDSEYLEGLSKEARENLEIQEASLREEMGRYQGQFYQVLNHASQQMLQKLEGEITKASEEVAKDLDLKWIVNRGAFFYIDPTLDVTSSVIAKMDERFESVEKPTSETSKEIP